jgi:replication factor A1
MSLVNLKDGNQKQKREILLADDSRCSISVTVWGEFASMKELCLGNLLVLKNCRVSEFNGKSLNASFSGSDYMANIKCPEATQVLKWFKSASIEDHLKNVKALSGGYQAGVGASSPQVSIGEMLNLIAKDPEIH